MELSFFAIDQNGRAQRSTRTELNLTLRPESVKRVSTAGLRANPRLVLAPGRYQIRVGARESLTGRVGTVFYDLQVPDFRKAPLMLSGLLVTAASSQAVFTAQPDPSAPKLLPGPATSRRAFSQNDKVTVFAEIYDNSSRRQPRQLDAGITLISESGQTVFSATDSIANPRASLGAADAAYWSAYGLTRDIPLTGVAAGRYLLRVEARVRGDDGAAVQETLITVQP
jgi:hypothetical protein